MRRRDHLDLALRERRARAAGRAPRRARRRVRTGSRRRSTRPARTPGNVPGGFCARKYAVSMLTAGACGRIGEKARDDARVGLQVLGLARGSTMNSGSRSLAEAREPQPEFRAAEQHEGQRQHDEPEDRRGGRARQWHAAPGGTGRRPIGGARLAFRSCCCDPRDCPCKRSGLAPLRMPGRRVWINQRSAVTVLRGPPRSARPPSRSTRLNLNVYVPACRRRDGQVARTVTARQRERRTDDDRARRPYRRRSPPSPSRSSRS